MLDGPIIKKLYALDTAVAELRSLGQVTADGIRKDWRTRRAIERQLQVLVEITVDICQRLISLRNESPAPSGAEAIKRCIGFGALTENDAYGKMAQFRNFLVHRYDDIDPEILAAMVNERLGDFESFRADILEYIKEDIHGEP